MYIHVVVSGYRDSVKSWVQRHAWFYYLAYATFFVTYIVLACCPRVRVKFPGNYIALFVFVSLWIAVMAYIISQSGELVNAVRYINLRKHGHCNLYFDLQYGLGISKFIKVWTKNVGCCYHFIIYQFFFSFQTAMFSYVCAAIASFHNAQAVLIAAGITALVTLSVSLFAVQTKIDFTMCYGLIFAACMTLFFLAIAFIIVYAAIPPGENGKNYYVSHHPI